MSRKRYHVSFGETYLIALDVFMLISTMGLTMGILYFVINPHLQFSQPGILGSMYSIKKDRQAYENIAYLIPLKIFTEDSITILQNSIQDNEIKRFAYVSSPDANVAKFFQTRRNDQIRYDLVCECEISESYVIFNFYLSVFNIREDEFEGLRELTSEDDKILKNKILGEIRKWEDLANILGL